MRGARIGKAGLRTIFAVLLTSCAVDGNALAAAGDTAASRSAAHTVTPQQQDDLAGDIVFSVPSGTFHGQVSVRMSTPIANAQIRYTVDGSPPTIGSPIYGGQPFVFTTTTQLRARAFLGSTPRGAVGTALYIARSFDLRHDLPLLVMDAYGRGKPDREYQDVALLLMEPRGGTSSLAQNPTLATRAGFHLRGQSSADFEKAPYRLELRDNADEDADHPLLGMPADSDWVLRGPFPDKTLIRDALAYSLGGDLGLRAPRFAFVELYLNLDSHPMAADDYQGVYLLAETIKRSQDRLDLAKLHETDLTAPAVSGGYILQFNMMVAEPPLLQCTTLPGQPPDSCWTDLEVVEPKELAPQQQAWITNYIQKFHNALHSADPANPKTGYPAYIDVDSFVNRIIHDELSRPDDAYVRSTHFYKDRDGKLFAGPLWDYDLGYGAFAGFTGGASAVQGWQFQPVSGSNSTTDWFLKLMADPEFSQRVEARWRQLRKGVLSNQQLDARITALAEPLSDAASRNFERWPILGTSRVGTFPTQVTQTWNEQLRLLRDYLTRRMAWLDGSGWRPTEPF
jgi:hypothetical protein